jgi:ATP-dependent Lhr-like helicase
MAEYGKPGTKFIIRGSPWIIQHVAEEKVHVKPVDDPTGAIPSWIGEEIPVPFTISQEVGAIRGIVEKNMKDGLSPEETTTRLSEQYPCDTDTLKRALKETIEQIKAGIPVPTEKRITVEDWGDFVLIHVAFGSLTNRALAQLLGQLISDKIGYGVVVQHDPYRIFLQTMGTADAARIASLLEEVQSMPEQAVRTVLTLATVKTGLFKRRMVHVARRFGALEKWADFSSVSLQRLIKSFEGTAIYEEALKEVFTRDLDFDNLVKALNKMHRGEIEIQKLDTDGNATPIARLGIERMSMKTDLIPPERMRAVLIGSARARLLDETSSFVCTSCWSYIETFKNKDLPDKPKCPSCGSEAIGILRVEEEKLLPVIEKRGEKLTKSEERLKERALETSRLIRKYGKTAAVALSARSVHASEVERVLQKEPKLSDTFFELVLDAERKAISKSFH